MNCGTFEIDEIEISGSDSGDTVSIRALAAGFAANVRTKRSSGHEKKTLVEIARTIAAKHGMTVQGITKDVTIDRVTQLRKTDLGFLAKLAADYGYVFSVRDKAIIFTLIYDLEQAASATTIDLTEVKSYSLKDKSFQTYKAATVKYNNPVDGTTVEGTSTVDTGDVAAADVLEIRGKAENRQQAEEQAKSHLYRANTRQQEGNISVEGNTAVLAGNNFDLTGMGKLSGKFHVISSRHQIDRSGYVTSAEIKRLVAFTDARKSPKSLPRLTQQPPAVEQPRAVTWVQPGNFNSVFGN
jgi:phage protein D